MTTVLIIDDDPSFRQLAARILTAASLQVIGEADSVAEGMRSARALEPDAVLVDIGLPDGDGVTLARALAGLPWEPRVVLTSVDADAAGADDVQRCRASAFVHKAELPNAPLTKLLACG